MDGGDARDAPKTATCHDAAPRTRGGFVKAEGQVDGDATCAGSPYRAYNDCATLQEEKRASTGRVCNDPVYFAKRDAGLPCTCNDDVVSPRVDCRGYTHCEATEVCYKSYFFPPPAWMARGAAASATAGPTGSLSKGGVDSEVESTVSGGQKRPLAPRILNRTEQISTFTTKSSRSGSELGRRSRIAATGSGGGDGKEPRIAVGVHPSMGWIYVRFWASIALSAVFSPGRTRSGTPADAYFNTTRTRLRSPTRRDHGAVSITATRQQLGQVAPNKDDLRKRLLDQPGIVVDRKSHSPLLSQRYFFPITVPTLYLFGGGKPFMFHSSQWLDYLRVEKRGEDGVSDAVEIPGGGHWFFADKRFAKQVADRIIDFITTEAK